MYQFKIIQHQQTPYAPPIKNIKEFLNTYKSEIEAFKEFAISTEDAVGLAANQCLLNGERFNVRIVAVKDVKTKECLIAVNPKIVKKFGSKTRQVEGCLTWGPIGNKEFAVIADRFNFIDVDFYTVDGVLSQETHKGYQAQVWQHEVNHINGIEEKIQEIKQ